MSMSTQELELVCDTVMKLCGIFLDEEKSYLIESRFRPILEQYGLSDYGQLVQALRNGGVDLKQEMIDAITTNETLFFRDRYPFELFEYKILPELLDRHVASGDPRPIRVWSAACSTGQEPYSLAMILHQALGDDAHRHVELVATDICQSAIERAEAGWYRDHEINRGLPGHLRKQYFRRNGNIWQISPDLQRLVRFRRQNLLEPLKHLQPFDVVFCRNVTIYFNQEKRNGLFRRLSELVVPGGHLVLGSSESYPELDRYFSREQHCHTVTYRPLSQERVLAGNRQ